MGNPLRKDGSPDFRELGNLWGISLPNDLVEILSAYGDSVIAKYLQVAGPRTFGFVGEFFGPDLPWIEAPGQVGFPLLPEEGGLLLWGTTIDGDRLCMELGDDSEWRTVFWSRTAFDLIRYDLSFSDWLYQALTGTVATDVLPEWGAMPYPVEEDGEDPFGVPIGEGPAGASL